VSDLVQIITPDHPFYKQGRRAATEVLAAAERLGRMCGDDRASSRMSLAIQIVIGCEMSRREGAPARDLNDAANALASSIGWMLGKIPVHQLRSIIQSIAAQVETLAADSAAAEVFADTPAVGRA
jgi:hypothetical protein